MGCESEFVRIRANLCEFERNPAKFFKYGFKANFNKICELKVSKNINKTFLQGNEYIVSQNL